MERANEEVLIQHYVIDIFSGHRIWLARTPDNISHLTSLLSISFRHTLLGLVIALRLYFPFNSTFPRSQNDLGNDLKISNASSFTH